VNHPRGRHAAVRPDPGDRVVRGRTLAAARQSGARGRRRHLLPGQELRPGARPRSRPCRLRRHHPRTSHPPCRTRRMGLGLGALRHPPRLRAPTVRPGRADAGRLVRPSRALCRGQPLPVDLLGGPPTGRAAPGLPRWGRGTTRCPLAARRNPTRLPALRNGGSAGDQVEPKVFDCPRIPDIRAAGAFGSSSSPGSLSATATLSPGFPRSGMTVPTCCPRAVASRIPAQVPWSRRVAAYGSTFDGISKSP
jgi:hypothetical protein